MRNRIKALFMCDKQGFFIFSPVVFCLQKAVLDKITKINFFACARKGLTKKLLNSIINFQNDICFKRISANRRKYG